jgi:hypothetical protein
MRVVVDAWDPSYGSAQDGEAWSEPTATVNLDAEVPADAWSPQRPSRPSLPCPLPSAIVFVDGVRRIDARVWVAGDDGGADVEPGLCASWAAGAVRCAGQQATLTSWEVGRGLFSASRHARDLVTAHGTFTSRMAASPSPDALSLALQERMGHSERAVTERAAGAGPGHLAAGESRQDVLVVVDGPLRGRQHLPGVIGMVKTHHVAYLSGSAAAVLGALAPGERTPAFTIGSTWTRQSWYVRLPGAGDAPLAGVVRCECPADVGVERLTGLADLTAVLLPRFASQAHKDGRAPQNLYPIAGLERELRRRLGDAALVHRAVRLAAR